MKAVLISIRPEWVEKIVSGKKTIEVRKTKPSIPTPFKVYIYCTKASKKYQSICGCMVINTDELYRLPNGEIKHGWSGELMCCHGEYTRDNFLNGKVVGSFVCDRIFELHDVVHGVYGLSLREEGVDGLRLEPCLTVGEMYAYGQENKLYAWHISDLKIYDKPKALWQFYKCDAKSFKELCDTGEICDYCQYSSHGLYLCEGRFCDETYEAYLDKNFTLTRPPQSWMYVEELEELEK